MPISHSISPFLSVSLLFLFCSFILQSVLWFVSPILFSAAQLSNFLADTMELLTVCRYVSFSLLSPPLSFTRSVSATTLPCFYFSPFHISVLSSLSCLQLHYNLCLHFISAVQPSCCKSDTMVEQLTVCRYVSFSSFSIYLCLSLVLFLTSICLSTSLFSSPPPNYIFFLFFISSSICLYPLYYLLLLRLFFYCLLMSCFPILISAAQPSNCWLVFFFDYL